MPNLYNNTGLEPDSTYAKASGDEDELSVDGENIASLGFHTDGDEDADKETSDEEELEDEGEEELADDSDLNKSEDDDEEVAEAAGPAIVSTLPDDDENSEDEDLEEDEDGIIGEDDVIVSKEKIILAKQILENIQNCTSRLNSLFGSLLSEGDEERINISQINDGIIAADEADANVVEGVFNGEEMIGPDGKEYGVPANYASKSKLVEGDMLKLTITDRGTFLYKQTKPVERRRIIGKLEKDVNGNYLVAAEHKKFRVITASITYYKGIPGDKVVILVPISGDSAWAAVENVIKGK